MVSELLVVAVTPPPPLDPPMDCGYRHLLNGLYAHGCVACVSVCVL